MLSESAIIQAADVGARWFMAKQIYSTYIGTAQDVLQEARLNALVFVRKRGNDIVDANAVSWRVYYDLIDELRAKSKCRNKKLVAANCFFASDMTREPERYSSSLSYEWTDLFNVLSQRLTKKEEITFRLLKDGLSQAQIARELSVSRACVSLRVKNIRKKLVGIM